MGKSCEVGERVLGEEGEEKGDAQQDVQAWMTKQPAGPPAALSQPTFGARATSASCQAKGELTAERDAHQAQHRGEPPAEDHAAGDLN